MFHKPETDVWCSNVRPSAARSVVPQIYGFNLKFQSRSDGRVTIKRTTLWMLPRLAAAHKHATAPLGGNQAIRSLHQ